MRTVILLMVLICSAASAAEVYRWVDESGQVHYSDTPREGAELVILQKAQGFKAPQISSRPGGGSDGSTGEEEAPAQQGYSRLAITSPAQEEVFWNIEGVLEVTVEMTPRLRRGDRLRLIYDGQPLEGLRFSRGKIRMTDVYRGVHTLVAEVVDSNGRSLARTDVRTFMVQQTSIANPKNPVLNRPPRPAPRTP